MSSTVNKRKPAPPPPYREPTFATASDYLLTNILDIYSTKGKGRHNPISTIQPPSAYGLEGYEERALPLAEDMQLYIWEKWQGDDRPTYVVFHGINGHWGATLLPDEHGKLEESRFRVQWLKQFPNDANIIAVSMPGFGKSDGTPSEPAFRAANEQLIYYLLHEKSIAPEQIIAAGESMGANHALHFAAQAHAQRAPIRQVTAVAPFTSFAEAAAEYVSLGPWLTAKGSHALAKALFSNSHHDHDNRSAVRGLQGSGTKLLIISPRQDQTIPPNQHCSLFATAIGADIDTAFQRQEEKNHIDWDPEAVMKADRELRDHPYNEALVMRILGVPDDASPVPPLPEDASKEERPDLPNRSHHSPSR